MRTAQDQAAREALRWVVDLLHAHHVPFQVVGGLAARAYGATRPLADIDLYIPGAHLATVLEAVGAFITRPLAQHRDERWDLVFMRLEYAGQAIEIGVADDARYRDSQQGRWHDAAIEFEASEQVEVLGVEVPVIAREQLLLYKRGLNRRVDHADIRELADT